MLRVIKKSERHVGFSSRRIRYDQKHGILILAKQNLNGIHLSANAPALLGEGFRQEESLVDFRFIDGIEKCELVSGLGKPLCP